MSGYDFHAIEGRWQQYWETRGTFRTPNPGDPGFDPRRPKYYVLDMFPYPSGVGLHVGHPLGYIATDVVARYKRMRGFTVLHPMGFDAFGLPAQQFAVEPGVPPLVPRQAAPDPRNLGDAPPAGAPPWRALSQAEQERVLAEHRLAYLAEVPVNWCPALGTVLANEEVTNEGRSERGNHPVHKRPL